MSKRPGTGRIGLFVSKELEGFYQEIAGLLGVTIELMTVQGNPKTSEMRNGSEILTSKSVEPAELFDYDVILADGVSLADLRGISEQTLILVCGPVKGDQPGLRLKQLPYNLSQEGIRLLMNGREYTEKGVGEPVLDRMLEEIREVLRREVKNYLELPPVPWGYSYALALTHDIDILSLKEMPIARTFLGYFYRSSVLNWKRWRAGKVNSPEFLSTLWEMARTWGAKIGLGQDVWQRALPRLLDLEKRLGVRSSLYFMPFPKKAGILPNQDNSNSSNAPSNRASFYDVTRHRQLLKTLEGEGWEAGVHGIDAWHDAHSAQAEYRQVSRLTGHSEVGVRMHWLYFKSPDSFKAMEEGGFLYDATFGFNEVVGFRAGTLQPYHPLNCQTLWELPLHIQDGALMGEEHQDLSREDAFKEAKPILAWAKRFGGAVSLLWHNQSFTAPRFWGEVYEKLIAQGKADGAWIAVPREVLRWFNLRRRCQPSLSVDGTHWQVSCTAEPADHRIPPLRIRLYVDPERVREVSVPYEQGEGYIDFPAMPSVTLEVEGKV